MDTDSPLRSTLGERTPGWYTICLGDRLVIPVVPPETRVLRVLPVLSFYTCPRENCDPSRPVGHCPCPVPETPVVWYGCCLQLGPEPEGTSTLVYRIHSGPSGKRLPSTVNPTRNLFLFLRRGVPPVRFVPGTVLDSTSSCPDSCGSVDESFSKVR